MNLGEDSRPVILPNWGAPLKGYLHIRKECFQKTFLMNRPPNSRIVRLASFYVRVKDHPVARMCP